ncbi:MAG TPA: polysaccharide biosynthesis tyrosine autokinase [Terriglobales bacterium]|nr:polysaccharide biosynthesis tyrosine autokinase [Terriglobales bacterium]
MPEPSAPQEPQAAVVASVHNPGVSRPGYYSYVSGTDAATCGRPVGWDSGGLVDYWRILSRRKGTLLLTALLGALTAFFLTRLQSPIYRARTLLEIESLNEDFLNMRNVSPTASGGNFQSPEYNIRTQTAVLESEPVLERALDKMDLQKRLLASRQKGNGFPWLAALRRRVAAIEPQQEQVPPRERALSMAAAGIKVRPEPNTRVIEVTFDSSDPRLASDFVNSMVAGFTELSLEKRWQSSQNTSEWLSRQVGDVKRKLEQAEDALQKYASDPGLTIISEKDNAVEERLQQIQLELSKAQADRVAKQSRYELAATAPAESLPEVLDDATLKEYQVQLTTLRRQLAELSSEFTSQHPKVISVRAQITAVDAALEKKRSNIVARIRNEYSDALRRERLLRADYAAQVSLMSKQAPKVAHYSVLKREVDTTRQLYDSMMQRVKEAGLASAMRASNVNVIEPARPPRIPYTPNFLLNTAFGLLLGVCAGAAFIIQRARTYRGIQEPGEMTLELNVPELGVIPTSDIRLSKARRLMSRSGLGIRSPADPGRLELTTWHQWRSAMAESFRLTLASILLSEKDGVPPRVIVLSSANPGEGKTTVISNLGIALARVNRSVLLVDADMRKPRLHEVFDVDNSLGLSQVLAGAANPAAVVLETKIPNLFLLPSGQNADEKLPFTPQLRRLVQRLSAQFDMILIDTPPLLQMPDARLLSHQADAVILVVAQHTSRDAVLVAQRRLAEDGSYLLGTILNNWDPKTSTHGYSEYREYYGRYYGKGQAA